MHFNLILCTQTLNLNHPHFNQLQPHRHVEVRVGKSNDYFQYLYNLYKHVQSCNGHMTEMITVEFNIQSSSNVPHVTFMLVGTYTKSYVSPLKFSILPNLLITYNMQDTFFRLFVSFTSLSHNI